MRFNQQILFITLFFLSVIKPFTGENANRYMGAAVFALLCALCLYTFFSQEKWRSLKGYYLELCLFIIFIAINLLSIAINLDNYANFQHIIIFAFASIAVFSSLFLSLWLFSRHHNATSRLGWIVVFILAIIALWQIIDYPSSTIITQYFVSSDIIQNGGKTISSITRWHTIFGVMAAFASILLIQLSLQKYYFFPSFPQLSILITIILLLILLYTGFLSQSRNFLLVLAIGLILLLPRLFQISAKTLLLIMVSLILFAHLMLLQNDQLRKDYGQIFPYIEKIAQHQLPQVNDFIPTINNHTLTGRAELWEKGLELWSEKPLLGIGTGAFRALTSADEQHRNLHNFYLQVLVENGVIGAIVMLLLLVRLLFIAKQQQTMIILTIVLASLLFDNYLDYCFSWVFFVTWLFFQNSSTIKPYKFNNNIQHKAY